MTILDFEPSSDDNAENDSYSEEDDIDKKPAAKKLKSNKK